MIPLKDDTPRYSTPFVTMLLIATNTIIFLYQISLGPRLDQELCSNMA